MEFMQLTTKDWDKGFVVILLVAFNLVKQMFHEVSKMVGPILLCKRVSLLEFFQELNLGVFVYMKFKMKP